jgi:two-component system, cell cycle response regulator
MSKPTSTALRQAHRAWNLLHQDAPKALRVAEAALAQAGAQQDVQAQAWSHLVLGMHALYFGTVAKARPHLRRAEAGFTACADEAGSILARGAAARGLWREGRFEAALTAVLKLREAGLRVLKHEQRAVLLNSIAGCYSAYGDSGQAFAYMYEALRDAGPRRGRGFDVVLHCNLAHELMQIGDYLEALRHIEQGLERCAALHNPRLHSVLLINRVVCLSELGRAREALSDIDALLAMPANAEGRGAIAPHFETLAVAAIAAGAVDLCERLLSSARLAGAGSLPDEALELGVAQALLWLARKRAQPALRALRALKKAAQDDALAGQSLRLRARYFDTLSQVHSACGQPQAALLALQQWQRLQRELAQRASRARYQAAALHTELLRLQQRLDDTDARRRATERARGALVAVNDELQMRVREVLALQAALRRQATQDALTGLFNRRHLNDTLPQLHALARREGQPLALVILDMDHFKQVNDAHGHDAGDALLAAFGELLAQHSRKSDVACRFGGEEFCLLMPRTDAAAARRKAQALLKLWRQMPLRLPDGSQASGLSFSAGAADTASAGHSPDALLKAADDALRAAKQAGRSRVQVAA